MLVQEIRFTLGLLTFSFLLSGCSSAEPEAEPTLRTKPIAQSGDTVGERIDDGPFKLPTKHIVQAGDTLTSIAVKFYDNPSGIHHIIKANADVLKDPNRINAGQVLVIPEISNELEVPPKPDIVASNTKAPKEDDGPSDSGKNLSDPPTTHVVQSGESLQDIAQLYFGSSDYDSFIAEAERNKGLIQGETVAEGVKLFIPPLTDDMPVH